MKRKAVVARAGFSFRAGERIFLVAHRMQEYREILADATIALSLQLLRRRAHDAPVPLLVRDAKLRVAYGASYEIDLHHVIVPEWLA